jgi:hypothetical protein
MILASGAGGAAGPLGLLVVLLIGAATVFLIRNMNARLRRLPKQFEPPKDTPGDDDPDSPTG